MGNFTLFFATIWGTFTIWGSSPDWKFFFKIIPQLGEFIPEQKKNITKPFPIFKKTTKLGNNKSGTKKRISPNLFHFLKKPPNWGTTKERIISAGHCPISFEIMHLIVFLKQNFEFPRLLVCKLEYDQQCGDSNFWRNHHSGEHLGKQVFVMDIG